MSPGFILADSCLRRSGVWVNSSAISASGLFRNPDVFLGCNFQGELYALPRDETQTVYDAEAIKPFSKAENHARGSAALLAKLQSVRLSTCSTVCWF